MTFADYAKTWEATVLPLMKPATIATVRSHIKKLSNLHSQPLEADRTIIQTLFTRQAASQAPKTVRNLHSTWHLIMSSALKEGLITKIPQIVLPKSIRKEQPWFTLEDMRAIIANSGPEHKPLYSLLAETGLRIGEALGLREQDVDFTKRTLTVRHSLYNGQLQEPKTQAAYRTLSLSSELIEILSVFEGFSPDCFLFRSSNGKPLWPDKVAEKLRQTTQDLRISATGFHSWRRGNATLCSVQLEFPEKVLAYRLGHEAPGLTLGRYAQSYSGMDKTWADKIGKALFQQEEA